MSWWAKKPEPETGCAAAELYSHLLQLNGGLQPEASWNLNFMVSHGLAKKFIDSYGITELGKYVLITLEQDAEIGRAAGRG